MIPSRSPHAAHSPHAVRAARAPRSPRRLARLLSVSALAVGALSPLGAQASSQHATAGHARRGPVTEPTPAAMRSPALASVVDVDLAHPLAAVRPDQSLGAGVDGQSQGDVRGIYTPANVAAMRSAGLSPLAYRLRTELGVEAWHWNPRGTFSDAAHRQGYWTSSARLGRPIMLSHGYRLPRRGDTIDQANNDGYSRLDDGDAHTFWKSDPYLDPHFTRQPEQRHVQWLIADLGRSRPVDALRLSWGEPFARRLVVQCWRGQNAIAIDGALSGRWQDFPRAAATGHRGRQALRLASRPLACRFVRVRLLSSSHTAPAHSVDVRDRLGFAVREVSIGWIDHGRFRDVVRHAPAADRQTTFYVSSTDSWHRASDIDPNTEQPGLDRILTSGLTGGQPLLTPVAMMYGTPPDAAAELAYLHARRAPVRRVEMGEEPDGQLMQPEDYASLFAQFAPRLLRAYPGVSLGGPDFATEVPDWQTWADAHGRTSWVGRWVAELRSEHALSDVGFFSFEWYPYDDVCAAVAPNLAGSRSLLRAQLQRQWAAGLPRGLPLVLSEYGYSAFSGQAEVDLPEALFNADTVGQWLSLGGSSYVYGLEPTSLTREPGCLSAGALTLFPSTDAHRILSRSAAYWAARMITQDWALPGDGTHQLLSASTSAPAGGHGRGPESPLHAYALRRPDGRTAVLLVNLDSEHARALSLRFHDATGRILPAANMQEVQLSRDEYTWHPRGLHGFPAPDGPPSRGRVAPGAPVRLPPYSLTVLSACMQTCTP